MLTAMTVVDNLVTGRTDKANIWEVNTEMEYHEEQHRKDSVHTPARKNPAGAS